MNSDEGTIKYTISGEGAGTIFIIDELTGDIHAMDRLDREEKAFYMLRAQARERLSDDPLEPESELIIKVQDINDSEPKFLEGPYMAPDTVCPSCPLGVVIINIRSTFKPLFYISGRAANKHVDHSFTDLGSIRPDHCVRQRLRRGRAARLPEGPGGHQAGSTGGPRTPMWKTHQSDYSGQHTPMLEYAEVMSMLRS
ncbi:hypothetical protein NHX12_030734 [Muraenolepis orangiensis]|uniref:Cadherin domain-containing protein n=1 Tax=Muraenolepis orangiensis TaxID=630683 RepID=A0A9Q0ECM6_9TELE|nr:hypothetical protein NHX12_030734 [Muraenolepis orangiensis]